MWTTMDELNKSFAKGFAVAAVVCSAISFGIAYYVSTLPNQLYLFNVVSDSGISYLVVAEDEASAIEIMLKRDVQHIEIKLMGLALDTAKEGDITVM